MDAIKDFAIAVGVVLMLLGVRSLILMRLRRKAEAVMKAVKDGVKK